MVFPEDRDAGPASIVEESRRQSFIVRVWLEEPATRQRRATWRGRITHLPSTDSCYVSDLRRVLDFMALYLDRMGVELPTYQRLRLWLFRGPEKVPAARTERRL